MLRLVDTADERLMDTFAGYYAALNCVSCLFEAAWALQHKLATGKRYRS